MEAVVQNQCVISINYTLTDPNGQVLDSSKSAGPLEYIHGMGNIISGLENALVGKKVGEKVKAVIAPKDGYGEIRNEMIQTIPRSHFEAQGDIQVGMQFMAQTDDGRIILRVVKVSGEDVVVDGNHPLAGMELHFDVEIMSVRPATEEELRHGHTHSGGGCHSHSCESGEGEEGGGCCGGCH